MKTRFLVPALALAVAALIALSCGIGLDTKNPNGGCKVAMWPKTLEKGAGPNGSSAAQAIAVDCAGNSYIAGTTLTVALDGQTLHDTALADLVLIKIGPDGGRLWTVEDGPGGGSPSLAFANGVAVDPSGTVYVTGWVSGSLDGQARHDTGANTDLFLSAYGPDGSRRWTVQDGPGGATSVRANAIAVDSSGFVYLAGQTQGALDGQVHSGGTATDFFISKYTASGSRVWTVEDGAGGPSNTRAQGIAVDAAGNIYVTGQTNGTLDSKSLNGASAAFFLTNYSNQGIRQWTVVDGPSGANAFGNGVAVDPSGNSYVIGSTTAGLDGGVQRDTVGNPDLFVTQYSSAGVRQWTVQDGPGGASASAAGQAIAVDSSGNSYVSGYVIGSLDGQVWHDAPGPNNDLFLTQYNASGVRQWTVENGPGTASGSANASGVAIDSAGNAYVAGQMGSSGPGAPGLDGNVVLGIDDLFVIRYSSLGAKL